MGWSGLADPPPTRHVAKMIVSSKIKPVAAVICLVVRENKVLLVRRANPPDAGKWGFPGGKIEFGESLQDAALRELFEETHVRGRFRSVLTALDSFSPNEGGELGFHYVMVAALIDWVEGEPVAGDDALEAAWFALDAMPWNELALSEDVERVAMMAFEADRSR